MRDFLLVWGGGILGIFTLAGGQQYNKEPIEPPEPVIQCYKQTVQDDSTRMLHRIKCPVKEGE